MMDQARGQSLAMRLQAGRQRPARSNKTSWHMEIAPRQNRKKKRKSRKNAIRRSALGLITHMWWRAAAGGLATDVGLQQAFFAVPWGYKRRAWLPRCQNGVAARDNHQKQEIKRPFFPLVRRYKLKRQAELNDTRQEGGGVCHIHGERNGDGGQKISRLLILITKRNNGVRRRSFRSFSDMHGLGV